MSHISGNRKDDDSMNRLIRKRKADREEEIKQECENFKRFRRDSSEDDADSGVASTGRSDDYKDSPFNRKRLADASYESGSSTLHHFSPSGSDVDARDTSNVTSNVALNIMKMSGYREGEGLGIHGQGRQKPVEVVLQPARYGLGHDVTKAITQADGFDYDEKAEIKSVEETPLFLAADSDVVHHVSENIGDHWMDVRPPSFQIEDEDRYCDKTLIHELIRCKNLFDGIPPHMLNRARMRANPYETVKAGFFQNRAAMKTANLDRVFDWALSEERDTARRHDKNPIEIGVDKTNVDRDAPMFYFADVCAGPGGFSEYMLWRKGFYNAKGFGFTLRNNDDFKLDKFLAAAPEYFETYYGSEGNGDVTDPKNLRSLEEHVKRRTGGHGVHLVMCDGGFSVSGNENIQEILSKRLYLCQFIVGLSLNRIDRSGHHDGGKFLCKIFDIFTPFSIGLIYLMYCSFERISLHKPVTSRPANSERYIFCENLTEFGATVVKDYLVKVNNRLDQIPWTRNPWDFKKLSEQVAEDVYSIVPEDVIRNDVVFYDYVCSHNTSIIQRQILYLKKYRAFVKNNGALDFDQTRIREDCLAYWEVPNLTRNRGQFREPEAKMLEALTDGKLSQGTSGGQRFSLDILRPHEWRHQITSEFRATLLPESKEPAILVSAGGGNACLISQGQTERLELMALPARTILFVQQTYKYKLVNERIERCADVIYVLDAAVLGGDDISALPLEKRLAAVEKFCTAANHNRKPRRGVDDGGLSCELVCAVYQELDDLANTELEVRKYKSVDTAVFNITGDGSLISTCRGVRIVNIMADSHDIYWSVTGRCSFISDRVRKQSLMLNDVPNSAYASFYDVVRNMRHNVRPPRAWHWSWDAQFGHHADFKVLNVLHDDSHPAGVTMQALRARLADIEATFHAEVKKPKST